RGPAPGARGARRRAAVRWRPAARGSAHGARDRRVTAGLRLVPPPGGAAGARPGIPAGAGGAGGMIGPVSAPLSSPVFVGRGDELARLVEAWEGAAQGRPATVLVGGEAGVGKSRLLAELSARVTERGGRWMIGGCASQGGAGLPFAPVAAALRGLLRAAPPAEVDGLIGPARAELARLLPELGVAGHDPHMVDLLTTSSGRLFEVVLSVLHRIAGEQPLALVLEDLHWADPSTLALVEFVARNVGDEALLL